MIKLFGKPGALFSCVSDSYDIYRATSELWGGELREELLAPGGTLVVRPDSGDPLTVPVEIVERLANRFGYTVNSKG